MEIVRKELNMSHKKKEKKPLDEGRGKRGISRREFLKDAGILAGGTAIGSTVLLAACGGETTKTLTETVTSRISDTTTVTEVSTAPGTTTTATETISKFVCPICNQEFDSLSDLKAHFETAHPAEPVPEDWTKLVVNGQERWLKIEPNWSLMHVLREKLGLVGLKDGCDRGECGTCTVLVDGRAVYSCMMLAIEAEGKEILTIEGLSNGVTLHPIQQAFVDHNAVQCGFCVPGFILGAKSFLDENPSPTLDEVREGLSGHICTCGNSKRMIEAVLAAGGGI